MAKTIHWLGRGLGVLCAAALALAWAFALWVPSAGLPSSGVNVVAALAFLAFAVFAGIASAYGHAVVVVLLFLASFFPVGAALMTAQHWLRWVGWGDLGLLAAAVLMWASARRGAV
jgi:hypothetical protein